MISIINYLAEQDMSLNTLNQSRRELLQRRIAQRGNLQLASNVDSTDTSAAPVSNVVRKVAGPESVAGPTSVGNIVRKVAGPVSVAGPVPVEHGEWQNIIKKAAGAAVENK